MKNFTYNYTELHLRSDQLVANEIGCCCRLPKCPASCRPPPAAVALPLSPSPGCLAALRPRPYLAQLAAAAARRLPLSPAAAAWLPSPVLLPPAAAKREEAMGNRRRPREEVMGNRHRPPLRRGRRRWGIGAARGRR
ncbi:hypothetical protein E2562_007312 [Oryza meyeriana var. granulata]|uniref:Uncharacterized protein n=1 Tax=Oryza meyeriana var. granulata TaxID=110450 RepID=A0A6G1CZF5_9ORYZ|nr:hypothetical protein E2562_007312 [Oryza meyeriana var. granulata]